MQPRRTQPRLTVKNRSFIGELFEKRIKISIASTCLNVYADSFAPKDTDGNFLKADARISGVDIEGELIRNELKALELPEHADVHLQKSATSDSGWDVLVGKRYQPANLSQEAVAQLESLPPYGEVVGVQDGRALFDKDEMQTTVHAAPTDGIDKRPKEERIVYEAAEKQLSQNPSQASYTLQGNAGFILTEQGESQPLEGKAALEAFAALPNDKGIAWLKKYVAYAPAHSTINDLVTPGPKNHITPTQSMVGKAYIANVPTKGAGRHEGIKEGSWVSDLFEMRKRKNTKSCLNVYAETFSPKDNDENLLKADARISGDDIEGKLIRNELKALELPEHADVHLQKSATSDSGWDVLVGKRYRPAKLSQEAVAHLESLPPYGEVVGVQDGRALFDKDEMQTTVHAAPTDGIDKRPKEERIVYEAAEKQLSQNPSQASYTLQGNAGFILTEQGESWPLEGKAALEAFAALPNDQGKAWLKKYAADDGSRTTMNDLVTPGPKNHTTEAQSEVGKKYIGDVPIKDYKQHEGIKDGSYVSDLIKKRKSPNIRNFMNVYASDFAPKDHDRNLLKADARIAGDDIKGELIRSELKAQELPEHADLYFQKSTTSFSSWDVLVGKTYQHANLSPEAVAQLESLPPYGEVVGVQDGQPLFDKIEMKTTVHAAPTDGIDERPIEEKTVYEASQQQLSLYPSQPSYTLQGTMAFIDSDHGKGQPLQGREPLEAFAALPNDLGRECIIKYAGDQNVRTTICDLLTSAPKNHITEAQSKVGTAYYKITPTSKMRKAKKRKAAGPVGLKGAAGGGTLAEGSMIQVMSGDASPLGSSHDWFDAPESGIPAQPPSKVQRADESAESSQVSSARMTTDADTGIDYKNALRDVRDDREGTEKYLNGIDALDSIICKEPRKVAIIRDTIHNEPEFSSLRLRDLFESRIGAHWRPVMIQPDKEFDNVYHVHSVDPYTFWNPIQTKQNDRNYVPSSISLKSDGKIALEESKLHFDLDNNEALYEGLFKPDKPQLWCEVRLTVEKNADGSVPSDTDSIEVRPCSNTQEFDRNILMNQKKTQAHPHILESAHPPGTSYAQEKSSDIQRSRHY